MSLEYMSVYDRPDALLLKGHLYEEIVNYFYNFTYEKAWTGFGPKELNPNSTELA